MAITEAPPATTPLEVSLFRCAPENLASLSPAERAACGDAYSARAFVAPIPGTMNEQSRDAARWQVALNQRNTPLAVPCTNLEKKEINQFTHETANVMMTDPLCVLRNLGDDASP